MRDIADIRDAFGWLPTDDEDAVMQMVMVCLDLCDFSASLERRIKELEERLARIPELEEVAE